VKRRVSAGAAAKNLVALSPEKLKENSVTATFQDRDQKPGFWVDETPFRASGDPKSNDFLAQTGKNLVSSSEVSGGKEEKQQV
jgi:hypothetical protein